MILNNYSKMFGATFKVLPPVTPPSSLTPVVINKDPEKYSIMSQFDNDPPVLVHGDIPFGHPFVLKFNSSKSSYIIFNGQDNKTFKLYATY